MEISEVDWAKLAAFVDGEGYIAITKKTRKQGRWSWQAFDLSVRVANTDPRLPHWCKVRFGGNVNLCYGKDYRHCRQALYTWSVYGVRSKKILENILRHSVIKREQIEIALAFAATLKGYCGHRKPVPEEVKIERLKAFDDLRRLRAIDLSESETSIVQ